MRASFYSVLLLFLLSSCNSEVSKENTGSMEKWKKEILDTEADFASMVREEGITKAFLHYADDDAVLLRNEKLISGKLEISDYFKERKSSDKVSLTWKPDFVEVSKSGDLAYTYGEYIFTVTDSTGKENSSKGIFHTVWKRQRDGNWKFVWD